MLSHLLSALIKTQGETGKGTQRKISCILYPFPSPRVFIQSIEIFVSQAFPHPILSYVKKTWKRVEISQLIYQLKFSIAQAFLFMSYDSSNKPRSTW